MKKVLFDASPLGEIEPSDCYAYVPIDWANGMNRQRTVTKNRGYEVLQGSGTVKGRLLGGSLGPLVFMIKGTGLFPSKESWENAILFLDGMSPYSSVLSFVHMLRGLASARVFDRASGVVFSNTVERDAQEQTKHAILQVIRGEEGLKDLPILFNVNCGHLAPMNVLPYGAMAEINCEKETFSLLESGVTD